MIAREGKSTNQNYDRQAPEFATSINVVPGTWDLIPGFGQNHPPLEHYKESPHCLED
jgi:hypothetical protein